MKMDLEIEELENIDRRLKSIEEKLDKIIKQSESQDIPTTNFNKSGKK